MTVSGDAATAGSQIVVSTGPVKRCRDVGVPGQVLAELMLIGCCHHVGLVLIGSEAADVIWPNTPRRGQGAVVVLTRITLRPECVRPTEMDAVRRCELLAEECPGSPARSFILECEIAGYIAGHMLDNGADSRPGGFKLIQRANLGGILVGNVLHAQLARER